MIKRLFLGVQSFPPKNGVILQVRLLQQVMAATDADVAEESLPEANRTAGGSSTAATRYAHLCFPAMALRVK